MGRLTVNQVNEQYARDESGRSLASVRRARQKARAVWLGQKSNNQKQAREVIVPETITVQELANRMAERGGDLH